jgi:hypothetical protein
MLAQSERFWCAALSALGDGRWYDSSNVDTDMLPIRYSLVHICQQFVAIQIPLARNRLRQDFSIPRMDNCGLFLTLSPDVSGPFPLLMVFSSNDIRTSCFRGREYFRCHLTTNAWH